MLRTVALSLLVLPALPAQNPCEGNGLGGAFLRSTPLRIGRQLQLELGSANAPNGLAFLLLSGGVGPSPSPFVGALCLDRQSPIYTSLFFLLDAGGRAALALPIPGSPALTGNAPLFGAAAVLAPAGISTSKTVRLGWSWPDSHEPVAGLLARSAHTATALGGGPYDNRQDVLIAGGGGTGFYFVTQPMASTELYSPLARATVPGPLLQVPRYWHGAVRLVDGRVLLAGGVTTGEVATASCEIFDPTTRSMQAAAPMAQARALFTLTLLDDGRVLAAGGLASWQPLNCFATGLDSTELFDPATGVWTPGPQMATRRAGHTATVLGDGRVLLVAGAAGGIAQASFTRMLPSFTDGCELFVPTTNALVAAPPLPGTPGGRGFHAASRLPNGDVLVTGGAYYLLLPAAVTTNDCRRFDGQNWVLAPPLPYGVAGHAQLPSPADGAALLFGGFAGSLMNGPATPLAVRHDGAGVSWIASIGLSVAQPGQPPSARGAHTATALADGSVLLFGGEWFVPGSPRVFPSGAPYIGGTAYILP